ncbi:MAG TPA: hypothetical protein VHD90_01305 [Phototrophicaceae bacterium]|nr:hypothetical protein [Phototrophicaceae bacterium]
MLRIQFSDGGKATQVLTFDGEVLEIFDSIMSPKHSRIHISHIESMDIQTDRKGKHKLVTTLAYGFVFPEYPVNDAQVASVNRLIAQVREAKASFRFD